MTLFREEAYFFLNILAGSSPRVLVCCFKTNGNKSRYFVLENLPYHAYYFCMNLS